MKKILVVLAVLFIGILLAGCTSQPATPVATPTPTPVPTTVAPTTVVTTVVPTPVVKNITVNVTKIDVNVTKVVNVTAVPTPVPTYLITFTQDLTIVPDITAYVKTGTKVVWWDNDPYKDHTIQAIGDQSGAYFGTGMVSIPHDGYYNVTFDKAGSYDYTSVYQPVMVGKIVVTN